MTALRNNGGLLRMPDGMSVTITSKTSDSRGSTGSRRPWLGALRQVGRKGEILLRFESRYPTMCTGNAQLRAFARACPSVRPIYGYEAERF
jgi:hypothetical protein